jgi:hypothetical protein
MVTGMGAAFQIRKGEKEFLGQIGSRLAAGQSHRRVTAGVQMNTFYKTSQRL